MFIELELKEIEQVNALCNICDKYKNEFDVDISCGRYTVDGNSVLGVLQLLGRTVSITPLVCEDNNRKSVDKFFEEVKVLGGCE